MDRKTDTEYDLILDNVSRINIRTVAAAKKARAERLAKKNLEAAQAESSEKLKLDAFQINYKTISATDCVFRIMTWDHIPKLNLVVQLDDSEDESPTTEYDEIETGPIKYVKLNFPPFMHYRVDENGNPYCVGKSHWRGSLDTGEFCKDHGSITNNLALMFMKLCERYATRSNWRGYTYVDEMKNQALLQLCQIGLQFDESKSQNPFAYYTAATQNSFTRVLNIEKKNQNLRDDILEQHNLNPSYTRQFQNNQTQNYEE